MCMSVCLLKISMILKIIKGVCVCNTFEMFTRACTLVYASRYIINELKVIRQVD